MCVRVCVCRCVPVPVPSTTKRVSWLKPSAADNTTNNSQRIHQPAITNFTTCADPTKPGSGIAALKVLFHEAGHAAHFAVRSLQKKRRFGEYVVFVCTIAKC